MKIVLASGNKKKKAELEAILSSVLPDTVVMSLRDIGYEGDIEENGDSFEANSLIKASVPASRGYIGVGDDSGLCVDALGGRPGVYSARYSGGDDSDNIDKLLSELDGVPEEKRTARFVSVVSCVFPNGEQLVCRGEMEGVILTERHGSGGFGYDPVFYCPSLGCTLAECEAEEKNKISHRAKALAALAEALAIRLKNT